MLKHKLELALIVMGPLLPTLSQEIIKDTNIYIEISKRGSTLEPFGLASHYSSLQIIGILCRV